MSTMRLWSILDVLRVSVSWRMALELAGDPAIIIPLLVPDLGPRQKGSVKVADTSGSAIRRGQILILLGEDAFRCHVPQLSCTRSKSPDTRSTNRDCQISKLNSVINVLYLSMRS
jgi:hypothetical protein